MKSIITLILGLALAAATPAIAQAPAENTGGFMAASNSLRILSPTVDQKIGSTSVTVQYQLTDSAASAAPSPTYRVQLDRRDPVETLDTSYSFTGLAPGAHLVFVELVDANHTTITGSRAIAHFTTYTPNASQTTGALAPPHVVKANLPIPEREDALPNSGGELPLLALIGFGVLAGGTISAFRGRK